MISVEPLWWCWESELPDSLCDSIIREALLEEPEEGSVGITSGEHGINKDTRDSVVRWLHQNWAINLVSGYGHTANYNAWNFNVDSCENIQFTEYAIDQHYDFHMDTHSYTTPMRKVSIVVQLSHEDDFEGGDFEFEHPNKETEPVPQLRKRGTVLVFPSWYRHRVTPVTKGTRYTLVTWLSGPALV